MHTQVAPCTPTSRQADDEEDQLEAAGEGEEPQRSCTTRLVALWRRCTRGRTAHHAHAAAPVPPVPPHGMSKRKQVGGEPRIEGESGATDESTSSPRSDQPTKRLRHLDGSAVHYTPPVGHVGVLSDDDDDERGEDSDERKEEATAPSIAAVAALQFRRAMVTDSLFRAIQRPGAHHSQHLRKRVDAYVTIMKEDMARKGGPLIDINYRDTSDGNNTLLMKAVKLFGEICANNRQSIHERVGFADMDKDGAKDHLRRLMEGLDLNLKNDAGCDSLNFLINNIVINAQCYFDWWAVTQLTELKAPLESQAPDGQTPLVHCAGSGSTPNVVQLLIACGADMDAVDRVGNNCWHKLIASSNMRVLDALAKDGTLVHALGSWFTPNRHGTSPLQLASDLRHVSTESQGIYRIMTTAHTQWKELVVPVLETELTSVMQLRDLAHIALQYVDGSGKPWPKPPAEKRPPSVLADAGSLAPAEIISLDDDESAPPPALAAALGGNPAAEVEGAEGLDGEDDVESDLEGAELDDDLPESDDESDPDIDEDDFEIDPGDAQEQAMLMQLEAEAAAAAAAGLLPEDDSDDDLPPAAEQAAAMV